MVKLAKGLGTLVVAEFVGDQETRQELLSMGVRLGQGAFLGPSRDVGEIKTLQPQGAHQDPQTVTSPTEAGATGLVG